MKKILSIMLAFVSTLMLSMTFVSCGSDDDNSDPKKETEKKVNYKFEYIISKDMLKLYDVKTVLTVGDKSEELAYTTAKEEKNTIGEFSCMSFEKSLDALSTTKVTIKTTITLKSNWKELLNKEGVTKLYYGGTLVDGNGYHDLGGGGNMFDTSVVEDGFEEILKEHAQYAMNCFTYPTVK